MTNLTVPELQLKSSPGYTLPPINLKPYTQEDLHTLRRALYAPRWVGFFEDMSHPEYVGSGFMCWELGDILGEDLHRLSSVFYEALTVGTPMVPSVRAHLNEQGMESESTGFTSKLTSEDPRVINARREWHRHLRDHLDAILKED